MKKKLEDFKNTFFLENKFKIEKCLTRLAFVLNPLLNTRYKKDD